MNFHDQDFEHRQQSKSLEWPDDAPLSPEEAASLLAMQRRFWANIAPPIYNVRVNFYPELKLDWD
jgi:hypothetical protein